MAPIRFNLDGLTVNSITIIVALIKFTTNNPVIHRSNLSENQGEVCYK